MEHPDFYAFFWPGPERLVNVAKRTAQHANFVSQGEDNERVGFGVLQAHRGTGTKSTKIPRAE